MAASRVMALGVLALVLLAASMLVPARAAHASTTFTVNHTGDAGDLNVFSTSKAIGLGQNITATGPGGNTSEFSVPVKVVAS